MKFNVGKRVWSIGSHVSLRRFSMGWLLDMRLGVFELYLLPLEIYIETWTKEHEEYIARRLGDIRIADDEEQL